MLNIISKALDTNEREVKKLKVQVEKINSLEKEASKIKDFSKKTKEFKERFKKDETLDSMMFEAFSIVREASKRVLGMRHFDVQLMAGIALFNGNVVEQKTGEGKTLTATAPIYLRAISGQSVHLVTVNDYLSRVGAGWMAPLYHELGLSIGVIAGENKSYIYDPEYSDTSHGDERLEHLKPCSRAEAYKADITYGTNNEFAFDYLRDNMVNSLEEMVQRGHYYAIVDEVDQVLIDEARNPLIISAPDTEPTQKYYEFAKLVEKLNSDTDFSVDEKSRSATLTEHGVSKVEKILGYKNLYEEDYEAIHHIENALRARSLYLRDQQYVVKENQIIIVDEFTGRMMPGRRWADGMHQAVEAKEGVAIQQESKTLATISFQNYFRMYDVLSGMTGTAATESEEFKKIYGLNVIVVPTNKNIQRDDATDAVYKTKSAKYAAVAHLIEELNAKGQPVLVGTTSIDKNEIISEFLKRKKITHNVLNAKNHEREAMIIADAGKPGAVTVATNMAGRGVDIVLGGAMPEREMGISKEEYEKTKEFKEWQKNHDKVLESGGLFVIGTERHDSRRIDNQLRGRSGRQGDPGASKFYLSLEDDLMRIFGGEQISNLMSRLKMPEDQPIENPLVGRAIASAQKKVEGFHFDSRKNTVEYDDVINQQREIIYGLRKRVLTQKSLLEEVQKKLTAQVERIVMLSTFEGEKPDFDRILVHLFEIIPFDEKSRVSIRLDLEKQETIDDLTRFLEKVLHTAYKAREKQFGESVMRQMERFAYLGSIDSQWIDHIDRVSDLQHAIRYRAYGQRDPLVEFKNEAYSMFENLIVSIDNELARRIFRIAVAQASNEIPLDIARVNIDETDNMGVEEENADDTAKTGIPIVSRESKIGRNDPCWCGSGKKWKHCHYPKEE